VDNDGPEVLRESLDVLHPSTAPQIRWQGGEDVPDCALELMLLAIVVRIQPGATREPNVLLAFGDIDEVAGQGTARTEKINLEDQRIV
jgi:hypothetical protein